MRSRLWLSLFLLTLSAAAAQASEPDPTPPKVFRITGIVTSSRDGAPVAHCRITAGEAQGGAGQRPGQTQTSNQDADRPAFNGAATRRGGTSDTNPIFAARGTGGGQAFGGRRGGSQPPDGVETDAQGHFSLTVPHAGAWRLAATARGYRNQGYDEHDGFFSAVVLTAAEPELSLQFRLIPDGIITGVVLDEAGEAVRQAQVRVERVRDLQPNAARQRPLGGGFAMTDDRGRYEVAGLAPGSWQVRVNARPWYAVAGLGSRANPASLDPSLDMVYAETWFPAATDDVTADQIVLTGGEQREADIHLTPIPAAHLKIPREDALQPAAGIQIRGIQAPEIDREGGDRLQTTITTSGTEWDIGGLAPGNYTVRTGSGPSAKTTALHIAAGSPAVLGAVADPQSSTVTITVDGVAPDDVRVVSLISVDTGQTYATGDGRRGRGDRSDPDPATPRAITAPPGRYEVFLSGNPALYLVGLSATGAKTEGRILTLNGAAAKLIVHAGSGRGQVNGFAKLAGKPAAGTMVLLVPADFGQPGSVAPVLRDETNTDGSFALRGAIPDEYILVAIDGGWAFNWHDPATLMKYLVSGVPVDLRKAGTISKEVEAVAP